MSGDIQNRDRFLNHVAAKLGRERRSAGVTRPTWKHSVHDLVQAGQNHPSTEELLAVFKEQCERIHTTVIETSRDQLSAVLRQVVAAHGGGPVLTSAHPRFAELGLLPLLEEAWPQEGVAVSVWSETSKRDNIAHAAAANFAVVVCDYALAESGTVVLTTRPGQGRSIHYLPTNALVIVPKETLVPRMTEAVEALEHAVERGSDVPASIHFITGPSNSADIEMDLVVGVHGPLQAFYVVC